MRLSVIVPCLNAADTIRIQLEALAKQEWSDPWELIIVDNGSTDNTLSIIKEYEPRFENFKIVDASTRRGQPYALNRGVEAASGEAVVFCDADDEVETGWLREIGNSLKKYDFVASRFEVEKLSDFRSSQFLKFPQETGLIDYTYVPYLQFAGSCGMGVKKNVHESVNGFDESILYCFDTDYSWRIQLNGIKLYYIPSALVHIRNRTTASRAFKQSRNWGEYNVLLIKKFRPYGMPKPTLQDGIDQWKKLLRFKRLRKLRNQGERDRWIWAFGYRVGQLIGSVKHRTLAL